ncbi:hypothetical protein Tco_0807170 [Tanacetum coccineum]
MKSGESAILCKRVQIPWIPFPEDGYSVPFMVASRAANASALTPSLIIAWSWAIFDVVGLVVVLGLLLWTPSGVLPVPVMQCLIAVNGLKYSLRSSAIRSSQLSISPRLCGPSLADQKSLSSPVVPLETNAINCPMGPTAGSSPAAGGALSTAYLGADVGNGWWCIWLESGVVIEDHGDSGECWWEKIIDKQSGNSESDHDLGTGNGSRNRNLLAIIRRRAVAGKAHNYRVLKELSSILLNVHLSSRHLLLSAACFNMESINLAKVVHAWLLPGQAHNMERVECCLKSGSKYGSSGM